MGPHSADGRAPPIDLIDGERLCDFLNENALGVETTTRTVEDVAIETEFFESLEPKHAS